MNELENWRERLPSGERLQILLAVAAISIILLIYLFFIRASILPPWQARQERAAQLTTAEQALVQAGRMQEQSPESLRSQIATAQAVLETNVNAFLSESQAANVLNQLSQYAQASAVEIINLQTVAGPEAKSDVYDVRKLQLQATGPVPQLLDFVSRIQEAAFESLLVDRVSIAQGEAQHILTLDLTLYTSPYASETGAAPPTAATPSPLPEELAQLEQALDAAWAAGNWAQAINLLQQIRTVDPAYADVTEKLYVAYVNNGYQLLDRGDTNGAATHFNLALGLKPEGAEALAGLQQIAATPPATLTVEQQLQSQLDRAWAAEDWETAISLIQQILALNPGDPAMTEKLYAAHVNHGYQLAAAGRLEAAKQAFTRALDIQPNGEEAIAGLRALAEGALPAPPTPQPQYTIYVVQRGDTLFSISRRYGTTVQAIMAANGLTNFNIRVGQQLRIPTGP